MKDITAKTRNKDSVKEILQKYKNWMVAERNNSERTVYMMMHYATKFFEWLDKNGYSVDGIEQETVNKYINNCKGEYSDNSMGLITTNLRKLLVLFLDTGVRVKISRAKAPDIDKTPFTRQEINDMFREAKEDPKAEAILKVLYYSGIRKSEMMNLDISDIDFERLQLTIRHGKNNVDRVVNITRDCAMAIRQYLSVRPIPRKGHEKALFLSYYGKRISNTVVWDAVKKYAARAGIKKHVYPHKFRITMITHMAEAGLSPKEIQVQSGHSDLKTLMGYIQHTPHRMRKAYESVFEENQTETTKAPSAIDEYDIKKNIVKRFLNKEIDKKTMDNMLEIFDDGKPKGCNDVAYR